MSPFALPPPASFTRIYVGGLPRGTTEQELREALTSAGTEVDRVEFVVDRCTGAQRGFAFVDLRRRMFSATDGLALARLWSAAFRGRVLDIQGVPEWRAR